MATIVSGLQPTGKLHLGNYFGFVNGVRACLAKGQDQAYFFVADLHALTVLEKAGNVKNSTIQVAAAILASLSDYDQQINVFAQSHVPQHTELAWIANCLTPLGWLNRMHQFKTKAGKHKAEASAGLYTYPSLMAADILLYQADKVPVGEDQKQHVELACYLAQTLQNLDAQKRFIVPQVVIPSFGGRIMSLRDATSKMSKSDRSDYSRINLVDDEPTILAKIRKAKTDPAPMPTAIKELESRPEIANLLTIFSLASREKLPAVVAKYAGQQTSRFKQDLAEVLIAELTPVKKRLLHLLNNEEALLARLQHDARVAKQRAEKTMELVRDTFKLLPVRN